MNNTQENSPKILIADVETTGIRYGDPNPAGLLTDDEYYQIVSIGMIVSDTEDFKPLDTLYLEIKWDGKSKWDDGAEKVHGLSREHLDMFGKTKQEAAVEIAKFLLKHFNVKKPIKCGGHNFATFDLHFIRQLLGEFGVMFKPQNRILDSSTVGSVCYNVDTSDDLFTLMGVDRTGKSHNALDDAMATLVSFNYTRKLMNKLTGR